MSVRIVELEGLGTVKLVKRRGAKSLRLSVTHDGIVRVSMPPWVPFSQGINFVTQKSTWLKAQLASHHTEKLKNGRRIGKNHFLRFEKTSSDNIATRVTEDLVIVRTALPSENAAVQQKATQAAERALKKEAEKFFPERLDYLAHQNGLKYNDLKLKKMHSRWGSCSSRKVIALSTYLVQLPWPLIDYVMVHELLHTRHMHHGPKFWDDFEAIIPQAKRLRREVNRFKPRLIA